MNMAGLRWERRLYIISVFQERHRDYERSQAVNLEENNAFSCSWHVKTKKKPPQPFPHSPIQLLSACLSTEYIIIHSSVQECFKDATLSWIRIHRMHTFMLLLERDNPREAAGFWRRNCISIKSNNGTKLIQSVKSKQCWPTCCCHYHYGPLMLNSCNRMYDQK